MLSIVKSMSLLGLDGYLISVQVDVSGGLPGYIGAASPSTLFLLGCCFGGQVAV